MVFAPHPVKYHERHEQKAGGQNMKNQSSHDCTFMSPRPLPIKRFFFTYILFTVSFGGERCYMFTDFTF